MGICSSSDKDVTLLFFIDSSNPSQRQFCDSFIKEFKYPKSTPFKICSSSKMNFSVKVKIKENTTVLMSSFDPNDTAKEEAISKLRLLLDEYYKQEE